LSRRMIREVCGKSFECPCKSCPFSTQSPKPLSNMIIAYLGRNVKDYRKNFLYYLENLDLRCPKCGGITTHHASYTRHVHIQEDAQWITLGRVICTRCHITHAVIPDFIHPYKHYSTCDIELAMRDHEAGIPVEDIDTSASISTVRRWVLEFKEQGNQRVGALKSLLLRLYEKTINEVELAGMRIFHALDRLIDEFPKIKSSNLTIGDTNLWLINNMAGGFV